VLKVETSAQTGSQVDYEFTGIPGISSGHYTFQRDGSTVGIFNNGGTVTWTHDSWSQDHNFTLTYEETQDIELSWTDDSSIEDGFNIYSNASGSFSQVGTVDSNTESFTDTNQDLELGAYTCYEVTSYNEYGESQPVTGCITP
jgi:hypothetical protein